jgi:hypothetical protein
MLLKRHYNADGSVARLELKHTGTHPEQNFSTTLIAQWLGLGLATVSGDVLTLDTEPEPLRYTIVRKPGYYCCHSGKRLDLSPEAYGDPALAAIEARQYLKDAKLLGKASPDANNPAGYRRTHAYECVLDEAQHARFKAVNGALAPSMSHKKVEA